ncbi:MAG: cysteine desulfurase family protein [Christensenellales bacterium]
MIFLDNASTTRPDDEIVNNFVKYQQDYFNPGALYKVSLNLNARIEDVRKEIVKLLNGNVNGSFMFTGSSTEANNIIINSLVSNNKNEEYIFSSIEHPSVNNLAIKLKNEGRKVFFVKTNEDGSVNEEDLLSLVNKNTKFVSIINVSNETGAINDINTLSKKVKEINPKTLFHSDGVQALGKIKVDLKNIDFYTISSHKIYGLKGIAGFYYANFNNLKPFILGGGQEQNIRSGTTNAPMIFSLFDAIKNAVEHQSENYNYVKGLNLILKEKLNQIDNIKINSNENSSPYIVSFSCLGLNAETILRVLSENEIYVGLGSACSSKKSGNLVLQSMGKTKEEILGNLRVSFSKNNTKEEVLIFSGCLRKTIEDLREKLK